VTGPLPPALLASNTSHVTRYTQTETHAACPQLSKERRFSFGRPRLPNPRFVPPARPRPLNPPSSSVLQKKRVPNRIGKVLPPLPLLMIGPLRVTREFALTSWNTPDSFPLTRSSSSSPYHLIALIFLPSTSRSRHRPRARQKHPAASIARYALRFRPGSLLTSVPHRTAPPQRICSCHRRERKRAELHVSTPSHQPLPKFRRRQGPNWA
jgi:hypothetical protein